MRSRLEQRGIVTDFMIVDNGNIYDIHDSKDNELWLRKMKADGTLMQYQPLPSATEDSFIRRQIVGVDNDGVYVYELEHQGSAMNAKSERVVWYDMENGKEQVVYQQTVMVSPMPIERFSSRNYEGKSIYLGYLLEVDNGYELNVFQLSFETGEMQIYQTIPISFTPKYFHVSNDGIIYVSAMDSTIHAYHEGWEKIFQTDGMDAIVYISYTQDESLYVLVASEDGSESVYEKVRDSNEFVQVFQTDQRVLEISICNRETWSALIVDEETYAYTLVTYTNGTEQSFQALSVPLVHVIRAMPWGQIVLHEAVVICLLLLMRHIYLRKKLSLLKKQTIVTIPIIVIGGYILFQLISKQVTAEIHKKTYEMLFAQAQKVIQDIDTAQLKQVDFEELYESTYFLQMQKAISQFSRPQKVDSYNVNDNMIESENKSDLFSTYWLFRIEEGAVYTAICGNTYSNLNVGYIDRDERYLLFEALLKNQAAVTGRTYSSRGEGYWFNTLNPIMNDGEMIGCLEVGTPAMYVDALVNQTMKIILLYILCFLTIIIVGYVVVQRFFLHALEKLKEGANQIAKGDYSVQVAITATDETGDIATAFNHMVQTIELSEKKMRSLRDGYRHFVPQEMLVILQKESIAEVQAGSYAHLRATYLILNTQSFENLSDKSFFDALNEFYSCVIPHITAIGGVIERYDGRRLTALLNCPPHEILNAIIDLFAALDRINRIRKQNGSTLYDCQIMLSNSDSLLGVVGNEDRFNMIAVSRLTYEARKVGKMCHKYGCRLLMTSTVFHLLEEFQDKYRYRLLGFMSIEGLKVTVYDFYDAEIAECMHGKQKTKDVFEEGVMHYYNGAYAAAQQCFIHVIKQSPFDMAAREYLKDSHLHAKSSEAPEMLIEI